MNRRSFAQSTLGLAAALSVTAQAHINVSVKVKPKALRKGDLVGLFAPSGVVNDATLEQKVRNIESLGFKTKLSANIRAARGGYAGSAAQRAADVHALFDDAEVKALWAVRGGSGCASILPLLDYTRLQHSPKIVIGYSDITALLLALSRHCGLVCFHGPVALPSYSDYSLQYLMAALTEPRAQQVIALARESTPRTLRAGVAEGALVGGNLSIVSALVGTPYAAQTDGALLFLEEIGEAPYRIDRMLTQLGQSGALGKVAGVLVGACKRCVPTDSEPALTLDETLDEHLQTLGVPVVSDYSFGHITQNCTLPLGIRARLDSERHTITLLESPTVKSM